MISFIVRPNDLLYPSPHTDVVLRRDSRYGHNHVPTLDYCSRKAAVGLVYVAILLRLDPFSTLGIFVNVAPLVPCRVAKFVTVRGREVVQNGWTAGA